jgi:hypothetical protein
MKRRKGAFEIDLVTFVAALDDTKIEHKFLIAYKKRFLYPFPVEVRVDPVEIDIEVELPVIRNHHLTFCLGPVWLSQPEG